MLTTLNSSAKCWRTKENLTVHRQTHSVKKPFECGVCLPSLRHLKYPQRLKKCKLTTFHYRQVRGDIIEVNKIVSGKYDSVITPTLIKSDTHRARSNDLRLRKSHLMYDV